MAVRLLDSFWKNAWLDLRTSVKSILLLKRSIGWISALSVGISLQKKVKKGEPFNQLPPPKDTKDIKSRLQIGPAIILYELLLEKYGQQKALELVQEVAQEGAILFLGTILPEIDRNWYNSLTEENKETKLLELVESFPNSTIGALEFGDDSFRFEVKQCSFVELSKSTGHPELAQVFCKGDGVYFERHVNQVKFERPTTLAKGGGCCDFRFEWMDELEGKK